MLIIYINDLPNGLVDMLLGEPLETFKDWLLKFNFNKCVVMHYGHNNTKCPLFINGKLVESRPHFNM